MCEEPGSEGVEGGAIDAAEEGGGGGGGGAGVGGGEVREMGDFLDFGGGGEERGEFDEVDGCA